MSRAARARSAQTPPSAADCQSVASGGYSSSVKYLLEILGGFGDFGDFADFDDFADDFGDVDGGITTRTRV